MAKRRKVSVIKTEMEALRAELLEIERSETEPTEAQIERADAALAEFEALEVERADAQAYEDRLAVVRSASLDVDATEPGDQREVTRNRGPEVMVKSDPFEILRTNAVHHMTGDAYIRELGDANLRAIERSDMPDGYEDSFEKIIKRHTRKAKDDNVGWARNLLARQTDAYHDAFEKVTVGRGMELTEVERAAIAVGTNTAGGYLVPTHLDPTLILTNSGARDVVRQLARVVTLVGGANRWNGVTTAGSTASWDAELTEVSDDTPAIAPVSIPVFSAKSLIQASIESFEDINGLANDVQMLLSDSKTRLTAQAHMTGNGTTAPCGIFTALDANALVEVQLATGSTFTRADLAGIVNALGDRWTDGSQWLMHPTMLERIAALGTALGSNYSTDMTQRPTDQLLGFPVNKSFTAPSTFQTTTVDNLAVFGDFSNYVIVDKPGSTSIEFIPHLFNTSNNLPDGRRAWYMHFREGADSVNDLAFRLLQDKTTA